MDSMNARVRAKADQTETAKLWNEAKRHPLNEDFKDLYNQTLVPMKEFQESMFIYKSEHKQMREMIRQFDTTMLTKANKVDFFEMRKNLDSKMSQEMVKKREDAMQQKIENFRTDIKDLTNKLQIIQQTMSQGIYDAVKKANHQIQISLEKKMQANRGSPKLGKEVARSPRSPIEIKVSQASGKKGRNTTMAKYTNKAGDIAEPLNAPSSDEVEVMLRGKANMSDLKHLMDVKSNKYDTEQNMRSIDILHKQVTHVIVLLIELLKTSIN